MAVYCQRMEKKMIPINLSGDICTQSVLGSCLFMKIKHFRKIGKFNKNMFLFFSDDDMCKKFRSISKSIIQTYDSRCIHQHGQSKIKNYLKRIFMVNYYMRLDHLIYFSKVEIGNLERKHKFKKSYILKFILNLFKLNLKKSIYFLSIILAHRKFSKIEKNNSTDINDLRNEK